MAIRKQPRHTLKLSLRPEDRHFLRAQAKLRNQLASAFAAELVEASLADLRQAPEFAVSPEDALQRRETEPRHIHRSIPRSPVI